MRSFLKSADRFGRNTARETSSVRNPNTSAEGVTHSGINSEEISPRDSAAILRTGVRDGSRTWLAFDRLTDRSYGAADYSGLTRPLCVVDEARSHDQDGDVDVWATHARGATEQAARTAKHQEQKPKRRHGISYNADMTNYWGPTPLYNVGKPTVNETSRRHSIGYSVEKTVQTDDVIPRRKSDTSVPRRRPQYPLPPIPTGKVSECLT